MRIREILEAVERNGAEDFDIPNSMTVEEAIAAIRRDVEGCVPPKGKHHKNDSYDVVAMVDGFNASRNATLTALAGLFGDDPKQKKTEA